MPCNAIPLRGHHLLCMFGFRGLGYSPEFVENMSRVVDAFFSERRHDFALVADCDEICKACPYLWDGECHRGKSRGKAARRRDLEVLESLALSPGTSHPNSFLRRRVKERISVEDLLRICAGCQWLPCGYCTEGLRDFAEASGEPPGA